jgi:hypothetical protein
MVAAEALDVVEAIARVAAEAAPDDNGVWEMCVSAGQEFVARGDDNAWNLGDLALIVATKYGDDTIGKYAKAVGKPKSTIKQYRRMSGFWQKDTRVSIRRELPTITRSDMREAMRLGDVGKALWALEKQAQKDWPVEKFGLLLSRYLGVAKRSTKPVFDAPATMLGVRVGGPDGVTLTLGAGAATPTEIEKLLATAGKRVRLVIYDQPDGE